GRCFRAGVYRAGRQDSAHRRRIPWEKRMKRASDEQLRKVTIGKLQQVNGSITIVEYDPAWPALFEKEAVRIRSALGDRVLSIEHVGSTSVPGLAAKTKIDIL